MSKKGKIKTPELPVEETTPLNVEQERILAWLKKVRFRKNFFGGVVEADVWKKLGELNELYNAALVAERVRYDTLLEQEKASLYNKTNSSSGGV